MLVFTQSTVYHYLLLYTPASSSPLNSVPKVLLLYHTAPLLYVPPFFSYSNLNASSLCAGGTTCGWNLISPFLFLIYWFWFSLCSASHFTFFTFFVTCALSHCLDSEEMMYCTALIRHWLSLTRCIKAAATTTTRTVSLYIIFLFHQSLTKSLSSSYQVLSCLLSVYT